MNNTIYTKHFESLTDTVAAVLAGGKFPTDNKEKMNQFLDSIEGDVIATIEFPTIDIELEAATREGLEPCCASDNDNEICLAYFVCIKGKTHTGDIEWCSDDYVSGEVNVDFNADDWKEQLERDMVNALNGYAKAHGYSLTELNFNDFDR